MKEEKDIRILIFSNEFNVFLFCLDERTQDKFGDYLVILRKVYVLNTKIVKKLVNTDSLYELRISIGFNEYRAIIFSVNHENIIQATELVLLNGFLKKGTKDYNRQIKKAIKILNTLKL